MPYNLADLFEHSVDAMPERTALICGDRSVSYRELDEQANRTAYRLTELGLGPGTHVGIQMHNSVETMASILAVLKIRAVPITVNFRYTADELAYLYGNADMRAVLCHREYAGAALSAAADAPVLDHVIVVDDLDLGSLTATRDFGPRSTDDLVLIYTGGTTGRPKGVMWRQEDLWRVLGGGIDFYTGTAVEDEHHQSRTGAVGEPMRWFILPTLMHTSALMPTLTALFSGNTVVLEPRFDAERVWEVVQQQHPHVLVITGDAMGRPLIESCRRTRPDTTGLVAVASGAALFSTALKDAFLEEFENLVVSDSVGSSETGFGGIGFAAKGVRQPGGPRVGAGRGTLVLDDADRPIAPGGGEGRLAKSGNIPLGYYNDPVKTAELFREVDGMRVVVTGDRARVEDDGSVTLLGRGNMVINTGGEKVFTEEVESAVKSHPAVYDAVVLGVPDERWGHRVAAVVQPRHGAVVDFASLEVHLRGCLAGYKIPRSVWVTDRVERTPSGKPDFRWAQRHVETHAAAFVAGTDRVAVTER
ncbi:acyl-CoA synthetase [Speluncibacter jeojiensis]|uniref:Acyl-CoA synthetase n=1 Tax=Speluncibacter jeojiensis TaxID=2710754 RepID=A0A9X4RFB4_9ACTN|nr:acyl-CoA synthetase [Corynebacteriales bacterium D3-21]